MKPEMGWDACLKWVMIRSAVVESLYSLRLELGDVSNRTALRARAPELDRPCGAYLASPSFDPRSSR